MSIHISSAVFNLSQEDTFYFFPILPRPPPFLLATSTNSFSFRCPLSTSMLLVTDVQATYPGSLFIRCSLILSMLKGDLLFRLLLSGASLTRINYGFSTSSQASLRTGAEGSTSTCRDFFCLDIAKVRASLISIG